MTTSLKRSPWGQKAKARYNAEALESRAFEDLLRIHGWDWWHVNLPMRSKAGFPDYMLMRDRLVFVELKARNPLNDRVGKLSAEQMAFNDRLRRAGAEVHTFVLPDDYEQASRTLQRGTGLPL